MLTEEMAEKCERYGDGHFKLYGLPPRNSTLEQQSIYKAMESVRHRLNDLHDGCDNTGFDVVQSMIEDSIVKYEAIIKDMDEAYFCELDKLYGEASGAHLKALSERN